MTWGCFVKGIMKENEESSLTALNSICAYLDFLRVNRIIVQRRNRKAFCFV